MHLPRTGSPRVPNRTNIHRLAFVECLLSGLLARCPATHPLRAEQRVGETGFLCTRHLHFQGIGMIHTAYHVRVKADIPQSQLLSAPDSADDTLQRVTWVHQILLQILAASKFQSLKSTSALRASIFDQHSFVQPTTSEVSNRSYLTCSYLLRATCAILAGACMFADIYSTFGKYPAKRTGPYGAPSRLRTKFDRKLVGILDEHRSAHRWIRPATGQLSQTLKAHDAHETPFFASLRHSDIKHHSNIIQARGWCPVLLNPEANIPPPSQHNTSPFTSHHGQCQEFDPCNTKPQYCSQFGSRQDKDLSISIAGRLPPKDSLINHNKSYTLASKMYQTSGTLRHAKWIQMANPSEKHGGTNHIRLPI